MNILRRKRPTRPTSFYFMAPFNPVVLIKTSKMPRSPFALTKSGLPSPLKSPAATDGPAIRYTTWPWKVPSPLPSRIDAVSPPATGALHGFRECAHDSQLGSRRSLRRN
jgi:hypothetical protein